MPKKGKGRGRGRGRGRDQNKPGEPISPGKGEEIGRRNDDGGHHHELHVPAAGVASTATTKLEATTKEDQGVCDTQSQLEQMVISDKNVTLPTESTASVSVAKSTAENLKQATVDQSAAAQAPSQQTRNQAVNNQSVSLGSTTSATRSINGSGSQKLLARPGTGRAGRQIQLRANFLRTRVPMHGDIYHYDVSILPECPRVVNHKVIRKLTVEYEKVFKKDKPVFDGKKNIYSRDSLPIKNDGQEFIVKFQTESSLKEKDFKITIKYAARVSLQLLDDALRGKADMPSETIQALEVVLRMAPAAVYFQVGRSFFSEPTDPISLGEGCEIWYGAYKSIRPTQSGMMINIDYASTAFYKTQHVMDFLVETLGRRNYPRTLTDSERLRFQKSVKGLKVMLTYIVDQKRQKRILGIAKESAEGLKFDIEEGGRKRKISVAEYFKKTYNISLSYPELPCLKAGSDAKPIHLPMEVCTLVPGQRCVKKLSEGQTANMIRATAKDAQERKRNIEQKVRESNFRGDEYLNHFKIQVQEEMIQVAGRVLEAPPMKHADGSKLVSPRDGKWDMRDNSFFKGIKIDKWGLLVCCRCDQTTVDNFCDQLSKQSQKLAMPMKRMPAYVEFFNSRRSTLKDSMERFTINIPDMMILMVIVDGNQYAEIKSLGDTYFGFLTQCIKLRSVKKANPQLLANLCMKINAKVGGTNSYFENNDKGPPVYRNPKVFGTPVIFLGADVTHPAQSETKRPSIAAVVGSIDRYATRYAARVKVQGHRKEIIAELKTMTMDLLKEFYRACRVKPQRIIMYRDGVSEGQFSQVLQIEVRAVQEACRSLEADYAPLITFITVQKRHHVRLFAENPREQVGKSKNIPAGTVVDQDICHPTEFDFYLCSHSGIQGTSRPAHYRILWDDSRFTADELQQLTYALCHNYARCTRSVSIPPPAYYAHHVAMRARHHLAARDGSSQGSSSGESTAGETEQINKSLEEAVKLHENLRSCMYYI